MSVVVVLVSIYGSRAEINFKQHISKKNSNVHVLNCIVWYSFLVNSNLHRNIQLINYY